MSTAPLLCTLTRGDTHGGIARVSELLWWTTKRLTGGHCKRLSLFPGAAAPLTLGVSLRFSRQLIAAQVKNQPSWILFDHVGIARPQVLVPSPMRAPYAVFLHSLEIWRPLSLDRKRSLLNARVLIANSHYTAARAKAMHPDLPPIHVCHLALDERPLPPAEDLDHDLLARLNDDAVLIVGRMSSAERHKGHDELLDAWPDVLGWMPTAQLVIAGQGDDLARYQAKAHSLGIDRSVVFTGRVSESTLHALYDRAAVFAMPARAEGFGLVYLEAMSHRRPVIASTVDAASEIVLDGETGFVVDPDDRVALAARLVSLLQDASLRQRFGDAGHARWQAEFSFVKFESRLGEIVELLAR